MKPNNFILISVAAALCLVAFEPAHAIDVGGEAGRDVTIIFDGCYRITNRSPDRRVHVIMGIYSFNLQVGETKTLMGFGPQCVTAYVGENLATYIDPKR